MSDNQVKRGSIRQALARLPRDLVAASGVALALLAVYAATAPRTVTLEDDGLFIMAAVDAGVAHPPGYPLFTLLGHLFSWLPLGTPAYRLHLLSGLFGALACGFLFLVGRQLKAPAWAAAIAAASWGLSEHFWSQAIITEVYTLNALLVVAAFHFILRASEGGGRRLQAKPLCLAALCFGLGLANQWPLMTLAVPAFLLLLLPPLLSPQGGRAVAQAPKLALIATGLLPGALYLWMFWRSRHAVTSFYGPLEGWQDFWFFVSRRGYAGVDASVTAGALDTWAYLRSFGAELLVQLTPIGAVLALVGICWAFRGNGRRRRKGAADARFAVLASLAVIAAHGPGLILLLDLDYDWFQAGVFRPYPITAYGFWALCMGCGLGSVVVWLRNGSGRRAGLARFVPFVPFVPWAAALIPAFLLAANLAVNDRSDDRFAGDYARAILDTLPPDAVFFAHGDAEIGPLGYMHFVEGARPDVELVSSQGLIYPNRLFSPLVETRRHGARIAEYVRNSSRPVFVQSVESLPDGAVSREGQDGKVYGSFIDYGLYQRLDPAAPEGALKLQVDEDVIARLESLGRNARSPDAWIRHVYGKIMHRIGGWLGYGEIASLHDFKRRTESLRALVENHRDGLLGEAEVLVPLGQPSQLSRAKDLLEQAEALQEADTPKDRLGRFHYLKGFLAYRMGSTDDARREFRRSLELHPHDENPSARALKELR